MRRFAWLVAVLAATLAAPASALADKSYTISQAAVNVTVARTGEVLMREDLTFSFDGFFTGAYRDIPLAQDVSASHVGHRRGSRPSPEAARCATPDDPRAVVFTPAPPVLDATASGAATPTHPDTTHLH